SHWLTDTSRIKPGVLNDGRGLNYPHKFLQARWIGLAGENATEWTVLDWEFDPTNLSFEHLLLSVTQKRAESVIMGFKNALSSLALAKSAFSEEDLEIIEGCQGWCILYHTCSRGLIIILDRSKFHSSYLFKNISEYVLLNNKEFPDDFVSDDSLISDNVAKKFLKISSLRVWLFGDRYVTISVDIRSGRIIIEENNKIDDKEFIKMCEDKISFAQNDDNLVVQTLCYLKFKSRIDQIEKAAKYLQFDIHRSLILRKEDLNQLGTNHCAYLRFPQYDNHFLICGIVNGGLRYWLTTLSQEPPVKRFILVKDAKDPTHKLSSSEPIYLEEERNSFIDKASLELQKEGPLTMDGGVLCGKRNFEEIDDKAEGTSPRKKLVRANAGLEYEIVHLARISALCRMKEQIKSHELSFTVIQPDKSLEFIDPDSSISLTSSIPVLKMDRQSILAKMQISIDKALNVFGDIYIRFVGSRLLTTTACS
ncbi:4133_t:CDS:2, partial [Cetraspora pellucida]